MRHIKRQCLKNSTTLLTYTCTKILLKKSLLGVRNMVLDAPRVNNDYQINFSKNTNSNVLPEKNSTCSQLIFRSCLSLKVNFLKMIYIKALPFPFWVLIRWRLCSLESHTLKYTISFRKNLEKYNILQSCSGGKGAGVGEGV